MFCRRHATSIVSDGTEALSLMLRSNAVIQALDKFIYERRELREENIRFAWTIMTGKGRATFQDNFLVWDWIIKKTLARYRGKKPGRTDFQYLLNRKAPRAIRLGAAKRLMTIMQKIFDDANYCVASPPNWDMIYAKQIAALGRMA